MRPSRGLWHPAIPVMQPTENTRRDHSTSGGEVTGKIDGSPRNPYRSSTRRAAVEPRAELTVRSQYLQRTAVPYHDQCTWRRLAAGDGCRRSWLLAQHRQNSEYTTPPLKMSASAFQRSRNSWPLQSGCTQGAAGPRADRTGGGHAAFPAALLARLQSHRSGLGPDQEAHSHGRSPYRDDTATNRATRPTRRTTATLSELVCPCWLRTQLIYGS